MIRRKQIWKKRKIIPSGKLTPSSWINLLKATKKPSQTFNKSYKRGNKP
jgi:hypothetical protein